MYAFKTYFYSKLLQLMILSKWWFFKCCMTFRQSNDILVLFSVSNIKIKLYIIHLHSQTNRRLWHWQRRRPQRQTFVTIQCTSIHRKIIQFSSFVFSLIGSRKNGYLLRSLFVRSKKICNYFRKLDQRICRSKSENVWHQHNTEAV